MIDATFVEVPIQRNTHEQNAQIKAGEIPEEFAARPDVGAHKDCCARWTKKGGVSYFGYKDHVKVDVESKIIMDGVETDASVHDSRVLPLLVKPEDRLPYADSAYTGAPIAKNLANKGVEAQNCERGTRANRRSARGWNMCLRR